MVDNITGGGAGGQRGERATGTSNTIYDLSSVLYHALEGGASYDTYIEDAEREDDQELQDFFRRVRDEDSIRADEAQMLIAARTLATTASIADEPVAGATAPSEGLGAGAPRREETTGRVEGRPDMDAAATDPAMGVGRGGEPDIPPPRTAGIGEEGVTPRTEEASPREGVTGDTPLRAEEESALPGREGAREPEREREEDKGLLDRARDAIMGEEEEPRRSEETNRADREDRPSSR